MYVYIYIHVSDHMPLPIIPPIVPPGTAAKRVDQNDDNQKTHIENGNMPPLLPNVEQHSLFASITLIAKLRLNVAPGLAVSVVPGSHSGFWGHPPRRVLELEPTIFWWLAASRLRRKKENKLLVKL